MAAEALGQMGDSADDAIPALVRSLGHINPQVRGNAAEALGKMGDAAASAAPALVKAAQDEDAGVRCQVIQALGAVMRIATADHVLLAATEDADPTVRAAALEALGKRGEANEEIVAALLRGLLDPADPVKVEAAKALPRLAGPTETVIDGLCVLLEDDSGWVQVHAALGLGRLGPAAARAGETLLRAAQTGELNVREQAMRALVMIQPPEIGPALAAGLKDASSEIRKFASAGLVKAATIPPEVVPGLTDALRDPEVQVRANAAHALARLDALPAESIAPLIECAVRPARRSAHERGVGAEPGAAGPRGGDFRPTHRGSEPAYPPDRREFLTVAGSRRRGRYDGRDGRAGRLDPARPEGRP